MVTSLAFSVDEQDDGTQILLSAKGEHLFTQSISNCFSKRWNALFVNIKLN